MSSWTGDTCTSPAVQPESGADKVTGLLRTVIYIASVGYSGSTLLDMLLGGSAEVVSLGEIHSLARAAKRDSSCTCGKPVSACPFWNSVERELANALIRPELRLSRFPLALENRKQSLHRRLPTFADLLLVLGNRRIWKWLAPFSALSRSYAQSAANALALYRAVSSVSGTPIVVDSSKDPLPLKALYLAAPKLVRVIYLVRDGRAVSRSLVNRLELGFEEAARRWVRSNWNLQLATRSISRANMMLVRYEDLCRDTAGELNRLSTFAGVAIPPLSAPLQKERFHNIGGNPMRFRRDETEIMLDEKWRDELTGRETAAFDRIGGDLNRRLGYG